MTGACQPFAARLGVVSPKRNAVGLVQRMTETVVQRKMAAWVVRVENGFDASVTA